jgi:phosphatidylserine/phosphatidylglycerophosphate/cardiolipin synthase-like enzyme
MGHIVFRSWLLGSLGLAFAGVHCGPASAPPPRSVGPEAPVAASSAAESVEPPARIELVESFPRGTTLDHADIADAADVWPAMIDTAKRRIDLEHFYVSLKAGSRLDPTVAALERAGERGVAIRVVLDRGFSQKYPDGIERLRGIKGLTLHTLDLANRTAGVQHAKFFVVDDREAFLGSQNFDWRSLEHIQELGVRTSAKGTVAMLRAVFEADFADGAPAGTLNRNLGAADTALFGREAVQVTPASSPEALGPSTAAWELPTILTELEGAHDSVRVQVLTYRPSSRKGEPWTRLDGALRRAHARGVAVRLLVADWAMKPGSQEALLDLAERGGVEVKVVTIPQDAEGPIPYARVVHSKYMVADGARAWVGTSNWEWDYFYASRDVSVFVDGKAFAERLEKFFDDLWNSPYATPVAEAKAAAPEAASAAAKPKKAASKHS